MKWLYPRSDIVPVKSSFFSLSNIEFRFKIMPVFIIAIKDVFQYFIRRINHKLLGGIMDEGR